VTDHQLLSTCYLSSLSLLCTLVQYRMHCAALATRVISLWIACLKWVKGELERRSVDDCRKAEIAAIDPVPQSVLGSPKRHGRSTSVSGHGPAPSTVLIGAGRSSWISAVVRSLPSTLDVMGRFCSLIPGLDVKLSAIILAGSTVLSAVGVSPPHHGIG